MGQYVLSPQARQSLTEIRNYSRKHYGQEKATAYLKALRDRLRYLANDPMKGTKRDDLNAGYYSYFQGMHTIYYRIAEHHIDILDVLHQAMEPSRHLPTDHRTNH